MATDSAAGSDGIGAARGPAPASRYVWPALRIVYGLFFLAMGVWATTGIGPRPVQPTRAAADFTQALTDTGFMDPLLGASFLLGGGALLFHRTAPLGIVALAPSVAVILFFHLFLSGQYIWGPFVAAYLAALAWHYRGGFVPLWSYGTASPLA